MSPMRLQQILWQIVLSRWCPYAAGQASNKFAAISLTGMLPSHVILTHPYRSIVLVMVSTHSSGWGFFLTILVSSKSTIGYLIVPQWLMGCDGWVSSLQCSGQSFYGEKFYPQAEPCSKMIIYRLIKAAPSWCSYLCGSTNAVGEADLRCYAGFHSDYEFLKMLMSCRAFHF